MTEKYIVQDSYGLFIAGLSSLHTQDWWRAYTWDKFENAVEYALKIDGEVFCVQVNHIPFRDWQSFKERGSLE